jgi:hypothetical protein
MASKHWELESYARISAGDSFMNGRYTVVRKVGQGGQGSTFLVKDNELNIE